MRTLLTTAAFAALAFSANAANLVTNGGFETTTFTSATEINATNVPGWTTNGYNFVFFPGTADTTGSYTPQFNGNLTLWGPNDGSANGLPASSPDGGNFVGADGAYEVGAISQTINGLTPGQKYAVNFYWGGAQQNGFSGATTEEWDVSLGGQTQSTAILNNVNHGFTGWQAQTFFYTATSSSEVLSFLANGTPNGEPPFSLLDGVSLTAVPEPASWALMFMGFGGLGAVARRRRTAALAA